MVGSLHEYHKAIEMGLEVVMKNIPGEVMIVEPLKKNRLGSVNLWLRKGNVR